MKDCKNCYHYYSHNHIICKSCMKLFEINDYTQLCDICSHKIQSNIDYCENCKSNFICLDGGDNE